MMIQRLDCSYCGTLMTYPLVSSVKLYNLEVEYPPLKLVYLLKLATFHFQFSFPECNGWESWR